MRSQKGSASSKPLSGWLTHCGCICSQSTVVRT